MRPPILMRRRRWRACYPRPGLHPVHILQRHSKRHPTVGPRQGTSRAPDATNRVVSPRELEFISSPQHQLPGAIAVPGWSPRF